MSTAAVQHDEYLLATVEILQCRYRFLNGHGRLAPDERMRRIHMLYAKGDADASQLNGSLASPDAIVGVSPSGTMHARAQAIEYMFYPARRSRVQG